MKSQLLQSCQGCAPSSMGYLYHCHPPAASTNGGRQPQRYPPTAPLHLIIYIERTSLPTPGYEKAPNRVGEVPTTSNCFSTGVSRTFFTAAGRFLNRGGCCRHAAHDGGDGDDGKEGNSFSDGHWLQPHQGEADSIRHGFLCLPQSLAASTSGGRQPRRSPQPPHSTLLYI